MLPLKSNNTVIDPERIFSTFENYSPLYTTYSAVMMSSLGLFLATIIVLTLSDIKITKKVISIPLALFIIMGVFFLFSLSTSDKIDESKNTALSQAEESIDNSLGEKYDVKLRESPFTASQSKGSIYLSKELFNATSSDGKNIQISIELINEGRDLIAYSSGTELPNKK